MSVIGQFRCLLLDSTELEAIWPNPSADDLVDAAHAIVGSPPWQQVAQPAAVVVSVDPPRLALIARFGDADEARIDALRSQLDMARHGFVYLSYTDAEGLAAILAARLTQHIGRPAVDSSRYVAIPRGGHVVLGMVAYALGVGGQQLDLHDAGLWVVVDDCSISGARFLEWLDAHPGPEVVFAHLYSHPDLRAALERNPRVRACVAAADLVDHAPVRLGDGYAEWRAAWEDRDSGVWAGQTDRIAFAWNEPDTAIWNPVTGKIEPGWHLVGPRRCLKNRRPVPEGAIQQLPSGTGELRATPEAVWAVVGNEILLVNTASEDIFAISGAGAEMWREALGSSTEAEALERLGALFRIEQDRLRADWDEFVEALVLRGLLTRA